MPSPALSPQWGAGKRPLWGSESLPGQELGHVWMPAHLSRSLTQCGAAPPQRVSASSKSLG
jgi:hypothetical protein